MNIKQPVWFLRQWLNEDRITDPKKMVTNEDLEHWLRPLIAYAEAGQMLYDYIVSGGLQSGDDQMAIASFDHAVKNCGIDNGPHNHPDMAYVDSSTQVTKTIGGITQ